MNFINITFGYGSPPSSPLNTIFTGASVALIAGIVLFLLNWLREYVTAHVKRQVEASTMAFSLATQLDRLIAECVDVISDPLYVDPGSGITEATVADPIIEFPKEWRWEVLPKLLQYRIRSIPNTIDVIGRKVASIYEYGEGPPEYSDAYNERELLFAKLGLEALALNKELVKRYGVPTLNRGDWDPAESFRAKIEKLAEIKEKIAAQRPKSLMRWSPPKKVTTEDLKARGVKLEKDLQEAFARQAAKQH
jgi:hypothetical protein